MSGWKRYFHFVDAIRQNILEDSLILKSKGKRVRYGAIHQTPIPVSYHPQAARASVSRRSKMIYSKKFGVSFILVWIGLLWMVLLNPDICCAAEFPGKAMLKLFHRSISSNSEKQSEDMASSSLRGSTSEEQVEQVEQDNDSTRHGTVCIYQGSSCLERAQGRPGRFTSCNSEVEDDICMNFPTAGIVFKCSSENHLITYPTAGCSSEKHAVEQPLVCVDMTLGTYFLLCCTDKGSHGEPCAYDGAPLALSLEEQKEKTWQGGKFVKW